ncbi:claudin-4-like [Heterodontus francisci]|uniref:claudin-4-like n=1 Tax=Heterodontus francisci TaxID=7792 RepID=UPI00355C40DE
MASIGLQILGLALAVIGWLGAIIACALPMWKVSAFIGNNIVVAQIRWEGLWMNCVVQSTGQMQCKIYDSLLALSQDRQASRALMVISVVLGLLGLFLGIAGAKCTSCVSDEAAKAKVAVTSGVTFLLTALLVLVPASWSANTIVRDFYDPLVPQAQKWELGSAIYISFAAAALLALGGSLLCCSCPPRETGYTAKYSKAPANTGKSNYV